MPAFDLILRGGAVFDRSRADLAVKDGRVAAEADLSGCLIIPPFVDSHLHLDKALLAPETDEEEPQTLMDAVRITARLQAAVPEERQSSPAFPARRFERSGRPARSRPTPHARYSHSTPCCVSWNRFAVWATPSTTRKMSWGCAA